LFGNSAGAASPLPPAFSEQGHSNAGFFWLFCPPRRCGDRADIAGRVIGQEPNDVLKQPVISENRTGAGRTIAPNKGFIAA